MSLGMLLGTLEMPTQMMDSLEQLHALAQRNGFCRCPGRDSRHRATRTQRLTAATILLLALTRLCARVRRRRVSTLHQPNAALTSAHRAAPPQPPTSLFIQARPRAAAPQSTQTRLTSATRAPRAGGEEKPASSADQPSSLNTPKIWRKKITESNQETNSKLYFNVKLLVKPF